LICKGPNKVKLEATNTGFFDFGQQAVIVALHLDRHSVLADHAVHDDEAIAVEVVLDELVVGGVVDLREQDADDINAQSHFLEQVRWLQSVLFDVIEQRNAAHLGEQSVWAEYLQQQLVLLLALGNEHAFLLLEVLRILLLQTLLQAVLLHLVETPELLLLQLLLLQFIHVPLQNQLLCFPLVLVRNFLHV